MERTPQVPIKRKVLIAAGVDQGRLTNLINRSRHFKQGERQWGYFTPYDAFLALISEDLFNFMTLPYVAWAVDEVAKNFPQLLHTLDRNPEQFMVIESSSIQVLDDLFPEERGRFRQYNTPYIVTPETLKCWAWTDKLTVLVINLKGAYERLHGLIESSGAKL